MPVCMASLGRGLEGAVQMVQKNVGALCFALDIQDRFFSPPPDFILTYKNYYIYIFGLLFGECCIHRR